MLLCRMAVTPIPPRKALKRLRKAPPEVFVVRGGPSGELLAGPIAPSVPEELVDATIGDELRMWLTPMERRLLAGASQSAAVAVTARTTEAGMSRLPGTIGETAQQIRDAGGTAVAVPADLSKPEDRERLVAEATAQLGQPDILVSNAAVTYFTPVGDFTARRYRLMFDVQVEAPFHLATLVLPGLRAHGAGWILNISSVAARHPAVTSTRRGGTVYGMCKAALDRLTTGLAAELSGSGVSVNSLGTSGLVMTPGVAVVSPHTPDNAPVEPDSAMPDAALLLCTAPPGTVTGRIAYSMELLGLPFPDGPWALSGTY